LLKVNPAAAKAQNGLAGGNISCREQAAAELVRTDNK